MSQKITPRAPMPPVMSVMQIDEHYKRRQIRAYFFPVKPPDIIILIVISVLLFPMAAIIIAKVVDPSGRNLPSAFLSIGLVYGILELGIIFFWWTNNITPFRNKLKYWQLRREDLARKPLGQQIEAWYKEDCQAIITGAMEKLNISESRKLTPG